MSLEKLLQPRIVELGKIKIGGLGDERKAASGSTYRQPVKFDHFKIVTLYRGDDGKLVEDTSLMQSLALEADPDGKLRRLPITFLSNDLSEILQVSYLWYAGQKLGAKSDGETLTWYHHHKTGARLDVPKVQPWKPEYAAADKRWKLHTTLNCVIRSADARWGGVYKLRTTSRITGDQLYGSLLQLSELTNGYLRGLPFRLVVRPLKVAPEGKPTTVYVIHIELAGGDAAAIAMERRQFDLRNMQLIAEVEREYKQLLANPQPLDDEDNAEIAAEFHPPEPAPEQAHVEPEPATVPDDRADDHGDAREPPEDYGPQGSGPPH